MSCLDIIKEREKELSKDRPQDGHSSVPEPTAPIRKPVPDPIWDPPLGAERGVLTIADLPELERRLRLSGWKVTRRNNELICESSATKKIQ